MAWPDVSIEDFPPQRDDEPASLRQDILDELSDHFVCALNRELLKNSDEQTAKQRVLNQFGDPIKIARQLWLEAMKEKIMSQRIMTGVSVVMAVCCIAVVGIAWSLMNQSQGINQKMLEQLAAIADRPQPVDTAKIDQKMLNQLEQLNQKQSAQSGSLTEEMNQVSFQLKQDTQLGKPAASFTGQLTYQGDRLDSFTLDAVSDETGKLDFGKLPWGNYYLNLNSPWYETYQSSKLTLIPGRDYSQTIICPTASPVEVPVQFEVDWPDNPKSEDWFLLCDFRNMQNGFGTGPLHAFRFIIQRNIKNFHWSYDQNQQQNQRGVYIVSKNNKVSQCTLNPRGKFANIDPETLRGQPSINMFEGNYHLPVIYLLKKDDLIKLSLLNSLESYSVVSHDNEVLQVLQNHGSTNGLSFGGGFLSPGTLVLTPFRKGVSVPDGLTPVAKNVVGVQMSNLLDFTASKDQPNLWKIKLPELNFLNSESSTAKKVR